MGSSLRWLAVSSVSLALACSARGGGGGIIGGDASGGSDVTSGIDGGAVDVTAPPVDDGLPPEDRGKTPPDVIAPDDIAQPDVVTPVDAGPPPMCGDGLCNGTETCTSCERDCGACAATCGDGTCNEGETCRTCPGDCGACPPMCGDATCNGTETCTSCPADCGACPARCGDGTCNGAETCGSCPGDCGACPARCGDGSCNGTETCMSCPSDCGTCSASCGDGVCNGTETCTSCPTDCGACAPRCGDGSCNGSESCSTCPGDCGTCTPSCGDGSCNGTETCSSCAVDCGTCPTNCASITSCAACLSDSRCGWCTFPGNCAAGDNSGPSNPSECFPVFGTWVRTPSMCSSSPPDAGTVDTGVTSDPTRACPGTSGNDGLQSECGWRTSGTYTCTAGSTVTLGCTGSADAGACGARLGSCSGDPVIRVCPGSTPCIYSNRIASTTSGSGTGYGEDDGCGLCPLVRVTCPSSGRITVLNRGYYQSQSATCSVNRL